MKKFIVAEAAVGTFVHWVMGANTQRHNKCFSSRNKSPLLSTSQQTNRQLSVCLFVKSWKIKLSFWKYLSGICAKFLFKSLQYIFLCQLSSPIITIYCRPLLAPLTLTLLGNHIDLEKNVCTHTRYVFPKTKLSMLWHQHSIVSLDWYFTTFQSFKVFYAFSFSVQNTFLLLLCNPLAIIHYFISLFSYHLSVFIINEVIVSIQIHNFVT